VILVEFFDALDTLARAIAVWIVIAAAFGTVVVLGVAAGIAWVWRAVRRWGARPSWAHSRWRAARWARARIRGSRDYDTAA
jgi:hypothetical protein